MDTNSSSGDGIASPPSKVNPTSLTPCSSCGRTDVEFSKAQKKKRAHERKCTVCIANMSSCEKTPSGQGQQIEGLKVESAMGDGDGKGEKQSKSDVGKTESVTAVAVESNQPDASNRETEQDPLKVTCVTSAAAEGAAKEDEQKSRALEQNEEAAPVASTSNKADDLDSDSEQAENTGDWSPLQQSDEEEDTKPSHRPKSTGKRTQSIRDKMKSARENALSNKRRKLGDASLSDESDEDHTNNNISVEKLKQQILGRSITSYDVSTESNAFASDGSKIILDPSVFSDGTTVADHLRPHLSCPVCFERMYNPTSLSCGHSFCRKCLIWWVERGNSRYDDDDGETLQIFGTCPSCRSPIVGTSKEKLFQVNTALKACMDTLYGSEMNQRRLAENREQKKATSGEAGGAHERGSEELISLPKEDEIAWGRSGIKDEENGWVSVYAALDGRGRGASVFIRRNVVLDDCDQRRQISMAFTKIVISKGGHGGVVDVELCLLNMEEDEIDDSGFPVLVIEGSDDEALICTSNDRVHTCIESSARIAPAAALEKKEFSCFRDESNEQTVQEVPLSRGMIGPDGSVRFRIDISRVLETEAMDGTHSIKDPRLVKLKFRHMDTGAVLELRIPSKNEDDAFDAHSDGEVEFGATKKKAVRNDASRFLMDHDEEEEHDEPNEYEMDEFLVGSQETDEGSDEEDGCDICKHGGDLIVCDGGDNGGGCGKSFHLECIKRTEVPPGDWICKTCANDCDIDVGIEGHEYAVVDGAEVVINDMSEEESNPEDKMEADQIDNYSDAETPVGNSKKKSQALTKKVIGSDDSDLESDKDCKSNECIDVDNQMDLTNDHSEEETPVGHKNRNKLPKKAFLDSDSEDE